MTIETKYWKTVQANDGSYLDVHLVNGTDVRNTLDVGWVGGGHDLVDRYIPEKMIWIEEGFSMEDRFAFLVHELHERDLMANGAKYLDAHNLANEAEAKYRRATYFVEAPHISDGNF